ncbi:iron(III) dicitrate transport protein FecA [Lewinellaceae bacterium SD302]|nr:iron(III) dicitrate transport protein FecA [Lewinellaceae bacterium SD302]
MDNSFSPMKQFVSTSSSLAKQPWVFLLFATLLAITPTILSGQDEVNDLDFNVAGLVVNPDDDNSPLEAANVYLNDGQFFTLTETDGSFLLTGVPAGNYLLRAELLGYESWSQSIEIKGDLNLEISLRPAAIKLSEVTVEDATRQQRAQSRLRNVETTAIYAGRKTELIRPDELTANLAVNNAREIFRGVAGLTVWENDGGGLQLAIAARGLDPNRTSSFNTRQNGFDISADALGYPESYYVPPAQALERIELVRGAASLQYGTQFGGLLNFKLKEGKEGDPFELISETTAGSFGLLSLFNSVGGSKGKTTYYGFHQYKRGDGWRPNSGFEQHTGYLDVHHQVTPKLRLGLELTHMNYLAQQSGGLVDFEFQQDPEQSKRARNWFKVDWNLMAFHVDYELGDKTHLNVRTFALHAQRDALGELGPINRPDPLAERDLIRGRYRNQGMEARLLHRFVFRGNPAAFLIGARYYRGFARNEQGDANDGSEAEFDFLNPEDLERSSYRFPSRNAALFAEQLVNLGKLSITPGVRLEYIRTASEGYFRQRVFSGGQLIFDQRIEDQAENQRSFPLFGLGLGYRISEDLEAYGNISQNYRSINFTDLAVANPNLIVDSLLNDESGYNAELGLRGQWLKGALQFDANLFFLRYNDRIGLTEVLVPDPISIERLATFRTNVGDAALYGLELFAELDLTQLLRQGQAGDLQIRPFVNLSLIEGEYLSGASSVVGNEVELVPPVSVKTGLSVKYKGLSGSLLYTYVQEHYSDATNAVLVADATRGLIPTYGVIDFSAAYELGRFKFQAGVNNLTDRSYFTRRATGYPGPGIIPAEPRRVYFGLRVRI